ncbi:MAG: hypothetical protein LBG43_04895 [Treponema sp.]|nr:hypothetical protein [Treponema sp.]
MTDELVSSGRRRASAFITSSIFAIDAHISAAMTIPATVIINKLIARDRRSIKN